MNFYGMPFGMWMLFQNSFRHSLCTVLGYSRADAEKITNRAKKKYRTITRHLPPFEKNDRFVMNIISCAMLGAFVLSMPDRPDAEKLGDYYEAAMMTPAMKLFCRIKGKEKFSEADLAAMKKTAAQKAADRNPYSWNMEFLPYEDGNGYEARFTKCGICRLFREIGLFGLVPAMCRLDYAMSEAGGTSRFVRRYTIAHGDPYCDCGYLKKEGNPS
ncbi:MAG: L-2-amino-thiazoline-4-carboxylic acid hydrolase [Solobacterium sp.]|nr:L-2-amino-thiazoline-4-carboxylic acid hydrolase [Solobacterium sp.]